MVLRDPDKVLAKDSPGPAMSQQGVRVWDYAPERTRGVTWR
jgi:hypothetical protein